MSAPLTPVAIGTGRQNLPFPVIPAAGIAAAQAERLAAILFSNQQVQPITRHLTIRIGQHKHIRHALVIAPPGAAYTA